MADINLIQDELHKSGGWKTSAAGLWSLYIFSTLLIVEVGIVVGLIFYQRSLDNSLAAAHQEEADINLEASKLEEQRAEAISFQARLNNLRTLLGYRIFWSPVFAQLEDYTLRQAIYNTLAVKESEHKLAITGVIPDYENLAKLVAGLESAPDVLGVTLSSSNISESELSGYFFDIEVNFDPKLLEKR